MTKAQLAQDPRWNQWALSVSYYEIVSEIWSTNDNWIGTSLRTRPGLNIVSTVIRLCGPNYV